MVIQLQSVSSKGIYKQATLNGFMYIYTYVYVTVTEDVVMNLRGSGATGEDLE